MRLKDLTYTSVHQKFNLVLLKSLCGLELESTTAWSGSYHLHVLTGIPERVWMSLSESLTFREAGSNITLSANAYACFICGEGKQESCCVTWYICFIARALTASLLWLARIIRPFTYLSSPWSKKILGHIKRLTLTVEVTVAGSSQTEENFGKSCGDKTVRIL